MSKKIEELFDLPDIDSMNENEVEEDMSIDIPATNSAPAIMDEVLVFPDDHAEAMDKIYEETVQHAADLMDFGYSAEERSKATIFEKANMLYNTAISAKKAKRDAQHKEMDLELKRRRLVLDEKKFAMQSMDGEVIETKVNNGVGFFDRNEIVKQAIQDRKSDRNDNNDI
jgi:hypothetical protein